MKKFTFKFFLVLTPFYIVVLYYILYIVPNLSGDLGYLAKIPFGKEYLLSLEKNYLKSYQVDTYSIQEHKLYDIVTIGDSFSQQKISGYQNYLANLEDKYVLNIKRNDNSSLSPEQIALNHLKSGDLSRLKVKIVIIESVERFFVKRLNDLNFDSILIEVKSPFEMEKKKPILEKVSEWLRLLIRDGNECYVKNIMLNNFYFDDSKRGNKLYFIIGDLWFNSVNSNEINQAKKNIIKMKSLFESEGIKFIYIVAADKYDVYQSFALKNPYPKNIIMDQFNELEKTNFFVNSNNTFKPMVKNGIKDVYMMNDSHWSYKGSEAVAKELHKRILRAEIENKKNLH